MLAESPNSVSFLRYMVLSMRPCKVHVYPQQVFGCGLPDSIPPDRKCFLLLDYLYFLLQCRKHSSSNLELPLTFLSKRDTFGMGTRCSSGIKKELITESKERQGPTLGVCFTELPVF